MSGSWPAGTPLETFKTAHPKSETIVVTPQMADTWLSTSLYERQRKRADWQIRRLAIEIEKGRFIAGTQIHFGVIGGQLKLVNGQHTLAAIVRSGVPVTLSVLYTKVDSEDDLGRLYGRHDRHRGRTPHDAFLGMGLTEKLQLSEPEVNALGAGLRYVLMSFRKPSVLTDVEVATSPERIAEAMQEWAPTAGAYFDCVREARHGMKGAYRRAAVIAVGLATMRHQKDKATEFWGQAAQDDGLHRSDLRRTLNVFLGSTPSSSGDPITYMRNVASAWNKFYEGGEVTFLRPIDVGKVGITLRGTPYRAAKRAGPAPMNDKDDESPSAPARPPQGILGEARP